MMEHPKLTARQQQILELIQKTIAETGAPPTRAEIANVLGFKSANAAEEHLQALARKGAIDLVSGTSRGIRLKGSSRDVLRQSSDMFSLPLPGFAQLALPLIGRVAAGSPILAQEHVDRTYHVESHLFQEQPDYLLRVRGMSMRDAGIMDGDLLAVKATKDVRNGQIVVARLGEEVTVKRLRRTSKGVELIPENPDFQTIVVPFDEADFELRRRSREAMAQKGGSLRHVEAGVYKNVVDRLQLSKLLEDPKVVDKLAQAGFRGPKPVSSFYFFRFVLPFAFCAAIAFYLFVINDFGLPPMSRVTFSIAGLTLGYYAPNIYISNIADRKSVV